MIERVDATWLEDVLVGLLKTSTQVPFGETEIEPGDERIVAAVQDVVLPWIEELGPDEIRRHPLGDVAARFGPSFDDGLLIQTYIVSQHANLMDEERNGDIIDGAEVGLEGPAALGRGASQTKGPMAAALAALRARSTELVRPVWLAVNTEGRSSHSGSQRVIDNLGVTAAQGLIAFGTDLRVSLGNRGRVDVRVEIRGASSHSSQPWLGDNPIEPAGRAVVHLGSLPLPDPHPSLGMATATPYQFACFPIAPHTIPERAIVVIDRRLLPGEDPNLAVASIRDHLAAIGIDEAAVTKGVHMLPAEVGSDEPVVRALIDGMKDATGRPADTFHSLNAFDAGYACANGIPTPMFGPGKRHFAGAGLVGMDAVSLSDCSRAASVIAFTIDRLCGR